VYDSLQFHCPIELMEECIQVVVPIMEAANPRMVYKIVPGGLAVEAEASFGPDLANMEEWKG